MDGQGRKSNASVELGAKIGTSRAKIHPGRGHAGRHKSHARRQNSAGADELKSYWMPDDTDLMPDGMDIVADGRPVVPSGMDR